MPSEICLGDTVTLTFDSTGVGDINFEWRFESLCATPEPSDSIAGDTLVYVIENIDFSDAGCYTIWDSDSDSVIAQLEITVGSIPSAGTGVDTVYCDLLDEDIDLFMLLEDSPNEGGTWSPASSFNPSDNGAGDYEFTYNVENACGENSSVVNITVDASPDAGETMEVMDVCNTSDEIIELSDLLEGEDGGGTWSRVEGSGGGFDSLQGTFDPSGADAGTYTFRYQLAASGACLEVSSEVSINVDEELETMLSDPEAICADNPGDEPMAVVDLTDNEADDGPTGVWSFDGMEIDNPDSYEAGDGLIYTFTVLNGACTSSDQVSYEVKEKPELIPVADTSYCAEETSGPINLGSVDAADSISWTNNNPGVGIAASGAGDIESTSMINEGDLPVTASVIAVAYLDGCSSQSEMFDITVNPLPKLIAFDVVEDAICDKNPEGEDNKIEVMIASSTGLRSFDYDFANSSTTEAGDGASSLSISLDEEPGQYSIGLTQLETPEGCTTTIDDQELTVDVWENPTAGIGYANFDVEPAISGIFRNLSEDGEENTSATIVKWEWNFGNDARPMSPSYDATHPNFIPVEFDNIGTKLIQLVVTDENECTDQKEETLQIEALNDTCSIILIQLPSASICKDQLFDFSFSVKKVSFHDEDLNDISISLSGGRVLDSDGNPISMEDIIETVEFEVDRWNISSRMLKVDEFNSGELSVDIAVTDFVSGNSGDACFFEANERIVYDATPNYTISDSSLAQEVCSNTETIRIELDGTFIEGTEYTYTIESETSPVRILSEDMEIFIPLADFSVPMVSTRTTIQLSFEVDGSCAQLEAVPFEFTLNPAPSVEIENNMGVARDTFLTNGAPINLNANIANIDPSIISEIIWSCSESSMSQIELPNMDAECILTVKTNKNCVDSDTVNIESSTGDRVPIIRPLNECEDGQRSVLYVENARDFESLRWTSGSNMVSGPVFDPKNLDHGDTVLVTGQFRNPSGVLVDGGVDSYVITIPYDNAPDSCRIDRETISNNGQTGEFLICKDSSLCKEWYRTSKNLDDFMVPEPLSEDFFYLVGETIDTVNYDYFLRTYPRNANGSCSASCGPVVFYRSSEPDDTNEPDDPVSRFELYPNPTSGSFALDLENSLIGMIEVDIYSTTSALMRRMSLDKSGPQLSHMLELYDESSGMYFVRLTYPDGSRETRKIVVLN